MASINKVVLMGRLGKDPESRVSKDGNSIAKFSLATDDGFGDHKKTNWHNIVVFGKRSEFVTTWLKKGSTAVVDGRIDYDEYTNKEGVKVRATIIVADKVDFGEGKPKNESKNSTKQSKSDDDEDDIPF